MREGRAGSPRAGSLPLAELGVLLPRHPSTLYLKSTHASTKPERILDRRRTVRIMPGAANVAVGGGAESLHFRLAVRVSITRRAPGSAVAARERRRTGS